MKVIMLAAGKGTRISRKIREVPKSTLPIDGIPLIRLNAEAYLKRGFEVVVVAGYKHELILDALKGLNVKYYFNPFYAVTNSIGSIWVARNELDDDCIIMNADVYYDPEILNKLLDSKEDVVMVSDSSRIEVGDYFFGTDSEGHITKYGKGLPLEERSSEYVGLALVRKGFIDVFKKETDRLVWDEHYDYWWENALYSLADKGNKIPTIDVSGYFWSEIDYFDDYMRILNYVRKKS
ncbi:MAG: phosphocholine cytidylyltransferase family protein [Erysipelotrichaceae bacterium]|nr:phosphocholine cytidylyltransferase family protein [Erysipelotrichaceae bacterium]